MNMELELRGLWKEAFGDTDAFLDLFFSTAYAPRRCRSILRSGKPAAALYWLDCSWQGEKVAYLYAVATAKAFRGQGLCRQLMEQTLSDLQQQGYAGAVLVPGSDALREMYAKLGFSPLCSRDAFEALPGAPIPLQTLTAAQYGLARRDFLPEGSILQEEESLAFLAGQAQFYRGEDFLLVALREGDALICPELLGNRNAAAGITAALGCRKGTFYTPGGQLPFAMWYGLKNCGKPCYFGLAFD